ncbi:MAG TPA: 60S ribosomal export protein NMD3 [Methanothrix sp.]|nr:60S ribosomal export protein NMD3 [Methanothrix sp.]HOU71228.1 60S ribosomal export protein NMD3 [Methanothrix sp.]HQE97645.1 60S ribosomal export protein NMD3 [Methanothrix sp.]HQJ79180.1 60S ribosomal export protein NMD3 [Methanothrix sp.]HUM81587.1 60S ribosomal export protein NMD3 [Methanothrix sp.]
MKPSICPRCGRPTEDDRCPQCVQETTELARAPNLLEVVICSKCGSQQINSKWQLPGTLPLEDMASQAAADSIWLHKELMQPQIDIDLETTGATRYLARIDVRGSFRGKRAVLQLEVPVRIKKVACERCSRLAGKYFESTVQLRGSCERPIMEREIEECKKMAEDMADASYRGGDQHSFIQEIKEVKGGLDIILGSTQLGRRMARAFLERFGGRLLETAKLVGKKDNRDIYRTTLLVRFPRLKRGDIIFFRGVISVVSGFDGKTTMISSLREGRRSSISSEGSEALEILGNKGDAISATTISVDDDVVEIMDPETFRTSLAARPKNRPVLPGEEVKVVRTADGFIIL